MLIASVDMKSFLLKVNLAEDEAIVESKKFMKITNRQSNREELGHKVVPDDKVDKIGILIDDSGY